MREQSHQHTEIIKFVKGHLGRSQLVVKKINFREGLFEHCRASNWQISRVKEEDKLQLPPLINGVYRLKALPLACSQCLCVVNKVLLFKHVQAWQFSFPRCIASESPGPELGTGQREKHHWMVPVVRSTVYCWCCYSAKVPPLIGCLCWLLFSWRPPKPPAISGLRINQRRSTQWNKLDVPAARRREKFHCSTTIYDMDGWSSGHILLLQRQDVHVSQG